MTGSKSAFSWVSYHLFSLFCCSIDHFLEDYRILLSSPLCCRSTSCYQTARVSNTLDIIFISLLAYFLALFGYSLWMAPFFHRNLNTYIPQNNELSNSYRAVSKYPLVAISTLSINFLDIPSSFASEYSCFPT